MEKYQLIQIGEKLVNRAVFHIRWGEGKITDFHPDDPMLINLDFDGLAKNLVFPKFVIGTIKVYDEVLAEEIASVFDVPIEDVLYREQTESKQELSTYISAPPIPVYYTKSSKTGSRVVTLEEAISIFKTSESDEAGKERHRIAERLRKGFIVDYPANIIRKLSLKDYLIAPAGMGYDNTFCSRMKNDLNYIGHLGNARNDMFGLYLRGGKDIILNKTLESVYGNDINMAFTALKNSIAILLDAAENADYDILRQIESDKKTYYLYTNYMLKILSVYFPAMFVPVYTKETMDSYCRVTRQDPDKYKLMIDKNLALIKWKEDHAATSVWSNHYLMVFLDYLWRHKIVINDSNESALGQFEEISSQSNYLDSSLQEDSLKDANAAVDREEFFRSLLLLDGFEAKRYDGMNRVHFKYWGVGFAVIDMNRYTYNLGSREEYLRAIGIREFEYTDILGPNHAMLRGISNTDTTVLYKLFDYIAQTEIDWDNVDSPEIAGEVESIDTDEIINSLEGSDRLAVVKARVNQGAFRDLLIRRFGKCCLCGADAVELLFASHIKPWVVSTPKEKTDVNNGLLLCPNHDRLFDKGYISFDNDGLIMISDFLSDNNRTFLNVHDGMGIELSEKCAEYMEYHRNHIFNKMRYEL